MNLPNKLTVLRLCLIPVFVAVYLIEALPYRFIISGAIFAIAAVTDFLDGKIARKHNLVTDFGKFLDPIADKVLVAAALIVMLLPTNLESESAFAVLPWYCSTGVIVILSRELLIGGFRMIAASKNIVIAADFTGKLKTNAQDYSILVLLVGAELYSITPIIWIIGLVGFWLSVALTIISGIECLLKNKQVISTK